MLQDQKELLGELPLFSSHHFVKIVEALSDSANIKEIAMDTALPSFDVRDLILWSIEKSYKSIKLQVFNTGAELLLWGKAAIVYPVCASNCYSLSPHIPNHLTLRLKDKFEVEMSQYR